MKNFPGDYIPADLEAARQWIARHLHELRWMQFLTSFAHAGPRPPLPAALRGQATHDLCHLCHGAVHHHGAAGCNLTGGTDKVRRTGLVSPPRREPRQAALPAWNDSAVDNGETER